MRNQRCFDLRLMIAPSVVLPLALMLAASTTARAIDLTRLASIGRVVSFTKSESAVTFTCEDHSEVTVSILAPDLFRVRASFRKPLPARDHSWAIAKDDWPPPRWSARESGDATVISTAEVDVFVYRSPLIIEFRDAATHTVITADARPMMFDPAGTTIAAARRLGFDEHFYGLGEKAAHLDKRRDQFTNWNSDTPAYKEGTDPIYQTVPFYIGLEKGIAYGIFFDNSYRSYFDFGHSSQQYAAFSADGGEMNYYFFHGPSLAKILGRYADLTGHMPLPPKWALGNQQSRWSYYPESMAEEVVRRYREEDLPLDVLHLDIDFMRGYRVFTWDTDRFPNPSEFVARMAREGVKIVTIVDPGVKYQPPVGGAADPSSVTNQPELASPDQSYYVFNQGMARNFFQERATGQLFIPKVWPGDSVFVDFTLPDARRWWGDLHRAYTDHGVAGIWNDMNEPSDFTDQTGKAQMDVVSFDEGENSTHAKNRNVFALLEARATFEGLERLKPDRRPYIITRAGYAGIQRYSTMWTGDTTSTWDALALAVPMFETLGLSGEPFIGADTGGFIGRGNGELLVRSYQVSFLAPFCRNHKVIDGYDQEPWRFGKYYEDIIRRYLKLRYRLLPFLYTTLEAAHRSGVPLFRPLVLNYQQDPNTYNLDDEFMVGGDLLAAPVLKPDITERLVYLPAGAWYDYWTGKMSMGGDMVRAAAPLETVPMYVRAGSILPMGPEVKYVGEKPDDPLTFIVYPDEQGRASTTLYEDDGASPEYLKGAFRRTPVAFSTSRGGMQITIGPAEGTYTLPRARSFTFVIKSQVAANRVLVDGVPLGTTTRVANRSGWYRDADGIIINIADGDGIHRINIQRML